MHNMITNNLPLVREKNYEEDLESISDIDDKISKDLYAKIKLKKLLEIQTAKNEFLNERNSRLTAQQNSLLGLLQKKDEIINRQNDLWTSQTAKESFKKFLRPFLRIQRKRASEVIECVKEFDKFVKLKVICARMIGFYVQQGILKDFRSSFQRLKKFFHDYKTFDRIFLGIRLAFMRDSFDRVRKYAFGNILNPRKHNIEKGINKIHFFLHFCTRKRVFFEYWKRLNRCKIGIWVVLDRIYQIKMIDVIQSIRIHNIKKNKSIIINENKKSEAKCVDFFKKFKILNFFCSISQKGQLIKLKSTFEKLKTPKKAQPRGLLLILSLKKILKNRFSIIKSAPNRKFLIKLLNSIQKVLLKDTFSKIKSKTLFSSIKSILSNFESTLKCLESLKKSEESNKIELTELKADSIHLDQLLERLSLEKQNLTTKYLEKSRKCSEIQTELSKHLETLESLEAESQNSVLALSQSQQSLLQQIEFNNSKIHELENSIESYCNEILKAENDGRLHSLQFTQLQSSYKKAQELINTAIAEKNKLQALEAENKKQKILLVNKIDQLAEKKEKIVQKISKTQQEALAIKQQLDEKKNQYSGLQGLLNEYKLTQESLAQKKNRFEEIYSDVNRESIKNSSLQTKVHQLKEERNKLNEEFMSFSEMIVKISEESAQLSNELASKEAEIVKVPQDSTSENLKVYARALESKVKDLTSRLSESPDLEKHVQEKAQLENRIKSLQSSLNECNEVAVKSRSEVSEAIAEIENYASVLIIMEDKMNETENKYSDALKEKNEALEELNTVKQQYYNVISGIKKY